MLPINKKITTTNYTPGNNRQIKYIVIHYVGSVSKAVNNANYFYSTYRGSSAHYFVDETSIWQVVQDKDVAWHCGGGLQGNSGHKWYKICTNSNSIGIEMCVKQNNGKWYFEQETIDNTIELVKYLMEKYNIPVENVIRHHDVTGKNCPEPFVSNITAWNNFKNKLVEEEIDMEELNKLKESIAELQTAVFKDEAVFDSASECPDWAKPTIEKLVSKGYLKGDEHGHLGLSYSDIRILVILDRANAFKG